jgi:hypothetical protein
MNSLRLIYRKYNTNYKINKGKSSLTSLVACFILGEVYCKPEFNKDDMPVVLKKNRFVN